MNKMKVSLVALAIAITISDNGCSGAPAFTGWPNPDYISLNESFTNNTILFSFTVTGTSSIITNVATTGYDTEQLVYLQREVPAMVVHVNVITKNIFDRDGHGNEGYPGKTSVKLKFNASDEDGNNVIKDLTVYISDINDNAPILRNIPYTWNIPERGPHSETVYTRIRADDYDNGINGIGGLKYNMTPDTQSVSMGEEYMKIFKINGNDGAVTLADVDALDYETNSFYQFTIIVMDQNGEPGCNNDTADLIIKVLDVQDTPPFFTGIPYRQSIVEEITRNSYVLTVNAMDGDRGIPNNIKYSIHSGPCASLFNISDNGEIRTAERIDRDDGDIKQESGVCVLTIVAEEIDQNPDKNEAKANTSVTIYIEDINDNSPKFNVTSNGFIAEIQENTPSSVPITLKSAEEIMIEDADVGPNAKITLSLVYPNESRCEDFYITPDTIDKSGSTLIRVHNTKMLDFEERENITFLIKATDSANHTASATVVLQIIDMNDNNPQFENMSYEFHIPENLPSGSSVGLVEANDADSSKFGDVVYALYGGNDKFHINNRTGKVTTKCGNCNVSLDRETSNIHFMTLTATDLNGTVGGRSNSTSLVVHLLDVNDNTPKFLSDVYSASIYENSLDYFTNGTAIVQVQANDLDEEGTDNSRREYTINETIEDGLVSNFTLNETSGELHLAAPLDFEKLNNSGIIKIIIHAVDFGKPQLTGTTTVSLKVQDVNDRAPVFNQTLFCAEIMENATSSVGNLTSVTRVYASDDDGTEPSKKFQFFISEGAWSDFAINSSTGDVSVQINRLLDRDTRPSYNITILAIDMGSPPLTGTSTLSVHISDVNDKLPVFEPDVYIKSVVENKTEQVGDVILKLTATDTDLDNKLEYNITDIEALDENGHMVHKSKVEDYFKVFGNNGSIYIGKTPDREVAKTITLHAMVKDLNAFEPQVQNDTATVTITLVDINDNSPEFEKPDYAVNVSENAISPTILLTISATDRDENRTIRYNIESVEHDITSFSINPDTGVLSKTGELDREQHANLILTIAATDNGYPPRNSTTEVNVTVLDFNDNAPIFSPNMTKHRHILENATIHEEVLVVSASDRDDGPNANVTYKIDSGDGGNFIIDPVFGNITVSDALDRETTSEFTLTVKAMDNPLDEKNQRETSTTLKVYIDDVNDNPPEFTSRVFKADILENIKIGSSIITVTADDKDDPTTNNSKFTYSFGNNTDSLFTVEGNTGVINVNKSLLGKVKSHIIELVVTDHGNPSLTNNMSAVVNITVLDVNLNAPVISNLPSDNTIKVPECVPTGFNIFKFNYSDADNGQNAEADFNISDLDTGGISALETFEIKPDGWLNTKEKLDASIRHEYKFHLQVTDRGVPALSSEKVAITVHVTDVNDNLPRFYHNETSMSVEENEPIGTVVGSVTAHDPDLDSISCYNIIDSDMNSFFTIGERNGSIATLKGLDFEVRRTYTFEVRVKDCSLNLNVSECSNITNVDKDVTDVTKVTVNVLDINDNPPVFKQSEITVGMRRITEVGVPLDLSLKTNDIVQDKDTPNNGRLVWVFNNSGPIVVSDSLSGKFNLEGVDTCEDGHKNLICVTGNGSVINNKYYSEDMSGYLIVPVGVSDVAGSDVTNIKIFLIGDSQILVMTLLGRKEKISEQKSYIMGLYSNITGYTFVYDWVEDHKTNDGRVETLKTDLYFHVVNPVTQEILSALEALRIVDSNYNFLLQAMEEYNVVSIVSSQRTPPEEPNPLMTVYIMSAVIAVLVVTVIIVVYVSLSTRTKYKTKLKAATVKPQDKKQDNSQATVPGSNMYSKMSNPLLDAELPPEYDNISMTSQNSLDKNDVGSPREEGTGDRLEEREVTLDMFTEDTNVTQQMESPLDEALRLHEQAKSERPETEDTFENFAFEEEFESTEI